LNGNPKRIAATFWNKNSIFDTINSDNSKTIGKFNLMATLYFHEVSDQVAQAYFKAPKAQQQRLKRILEETILLWIDASNNAASTQQPRFVSQNDTMIQHTPGVCGGNACIRNTRIPVWTLVSLRSQGAKDHQLLEEYPSLNQTDLETAWSYYQQHQEDIDRAIAAQDDEE
jgi:uncharacterized protein (DUF433 family)